jgi:hypothetical protein
MTTRRITPLLALTVLLLNPARALACGPGIPVALYLAVVVVKTLQDLPGFLLGAAQAFFTSPPITPGTVVQAILLQVPVIEAGILAGLFLLPVAMFWGTHQVRSQS